MVLGTLEISATSNIGENHNICNIENIYKIGKIGDRSIPLQSARHPQLTIQPNAGEINP